MNNQYLDIVFEGQKFCPGKLKDATGIDLEILAAFGEMATKGRFKGKPSPYGLAILKIESPEVHSLRRELSSVMKYLLKDKMLLKQCGVEEVSLDAQHLKGFVIEDDVIDQLLELNNSLKLFTSNLENSPGANSKSKTSL